MGGKAGNVRQNASRGLGVERIISSDFYIGLNEAGGYCTGMSEPNMPIKDQLAAVIQPKNLLKTIASQVPLASVGVELLNQLEGQRVEKRIVALEESDEKLFSSLRKLESSVAETIPQNINEWPNAVHEYLLRNVELAVVHTPPDEPGKEYFLPVANGCLVGDECVLTCSEAIELARAVAEHKRGRVIIVIGFVWYEFEAEPVDKTTGLILCRITSRNEERWAEARELFDKDGFRQLAQPPTKAQPKWTITPWIGQECGFILASDSKDNMRQAEISEVEFGTSVISHFRLPRDYGLKVFVTAVFSGRIRQVGSAVFARDGTLLGIISGVEQYEYDAGRRAVVKSLLGFPKFTAPKLKPAESGTK